MDVMHNERVTAYGHILDTTRWQDNSCVCIGIGSHSLRSGQKPPKTGVTSAPLRPHNVLQISPAWLLHRLIRLGQNRCSRADGTSGLRLTRIRPRQKGIRLGVAKLYAGNRYE